MPSANPEVICDELRQLSFENPRVARTRVEQLLHDDEAILFAVLDRISGPGHGRLRQMVANATRTDLDRSRLSVIFERWLEIETDEFTKEALERARRGDNVNSQDVAVSVPACDPLLAKMYQYVTGRIGHELRNALLEPKTRMLKIRSAIRQLDDSGHRDELQSLLERLEDDFARVGRVCEFEPTDEHFVIQSIVLSEWLKSLNTQYAKQYQPIDLVFEAQHAALDARVLGSNHYLRMVFWNLWVNAHQASNGACKITIEMAMHDDGLHVVVIDAGDGIPDRFDGVAFVDQVSSNSPHRGRGLLEVQHAMQQMQGSASLARREEGDLRVVLRFPMEPR